MVKEVALSLTNQQPELFHHAIQYSATLSVSELGVVLPKSTENASPKRIAEVTAGRYCAKRALEKIAESDFKKYKPSTENRIDSALGNFVVESRADRTPLWPTGYVGSITHVDDFAWAAVAKETFFRSVGIDTEKIISQKLFDEIRSLVAREHEVSLPIQYLNKQEVFTLIFSAKESLFKCLYPLVGRFFDFLDVSLEKIDLDKNQFTLKLLIDLTTEFTKETEISGYFEISDRYVHTLVQLLKDQ